MSLRQRSCHRDTEYENKVTGFHSALRDMGFKVIVKKVRWYQDENGGRVAKANADLDLAVDALLQSENLDRADRQRRRRLRPGGARPAEQGLPGRIVALENVSRSARRGRPVCIRIPGPQPDPYNSEVQQPWGQPGSTWRLVLLASPPGAFRLHALPEEIAPGMWLTDTRNPDSPYGTAFFHDTQLPLEADP
jgi:hypothetical protein